MSRNFRFYQVSPTECFLRYCQLPDNDEVSVDLRQSAVVIMSHLDRLSVPYSPPATFSKVSRKRRQFSRRLIKRSDFQQGQVYDSNHQEVLTSGWLSWINRQDHGMAFQNCEVMSDLGVKQIVCGERWIYILSPSGRVYIMYYSSETQVCTSLFVKMYT